MNNNQIFDLDKIKELTIPIEELQIKINQLNESSKKITKNIHVIEKEFKDEKFLSQIEIIQELLKNINDKLNLVSKTNLNKFLDFQDRLIKKYKENFKENLKKITLNEEFTKIIGLFFIEEKMISKIIDNVSFIPSIEISKWLELLDSLNHNTLFLKSVEKIGIYFQELLQLRLEKELKKIPNDTDPVIVRDYEEFFKKNPTLAFNDFLHIIESQFTQKELDSKKEIRKRIKEKEEFEKLKKKQVEQKKTYDDYLKLSESEFKRLRRKKSREKLTDVSTDTNMEKEIGISEEVFEKIKKFKSQFEKSFDEKYMIQKDDDTDPIDIIRERKKKKEKEYKEYKDHFDNP
ncbi:MAG: hypothetical protein HWN81_03760 [Candidatus Lokiarchaeota archaeon]|nr:hypothetical protein [Candidatus Lokiarchaeota archaeon]